MHNVIYVRLEYFLETCKCSFVFVEMLIFAKFKKCDVYRAGKMS